MKKIIYRASIAFTAVAMVACGSDSKKQTPTKPAGKAASAVATANTGNLPNYRFIDTDSIGLKYNLSIDFNEQMIKLQNNLQEEEKRQQAAIQAKANALQKRADNAQQTQSEVDALRKEYENLQNMQTQAAQKLQKMSMDAEQTMATNAQVIVDSLNSFLKDYAAQRGYDAVFVKNSAPYYNPALDVTDEVIEGLNARYNKVKK